MVSVFVFVIICVQFEDESSSEQQAVGAASASARQQQDEHGVYNAPEVGWKQINTNETAQFFRKSDAVLYRYPIPLLYYTLHD